MAQDNISGQDNGMDRIALLEQQIAAHKERRESIEELRSQYIGFVDEVRKLRGALRMIDDIIKKALHE